MDVRIADLEVAAERTLRRRDALPAGGPSGVPLGAGTYGSADLAAAVAAFLDVADRGARAVRSDVGSAADAYRACAASYGECDAAVSDRFTRSLGTAAGAVRAR